MRVTDDMVRVALIAQRNAERLPPEQCSRERVVRLMLEAALKFDGCPPLTDLLEANAKARGLPYP